MGSVINTGISALNAFKRQLEVTGHNIANVNTPGYSRQRVDLGTREPQLAGSGYIGSGVDVTAIRRSYDDYLAIRVRDYSSSHAEFSIYEARANQIDDVIADEAAGIDGMLQQFFASVNDVADDPTSIEARAMMLNRASQLSDRFNQLDRWFSDMRNRLNQDLQREVDEINSLAHSLTEVNSRIGALNGETFGAPNDLLDERDRLVDELSKYTSVSSLEQNDGSVNVFIGTGQALVVGTARNAIALEPNALAEDQVELVIRQAGLPSVNVTNQMTGGSLGGLLRFRDEILDEAHNSLGRVAIGLTSFFNDEHRTGLDLDGQLGVDFFSAQTSPQVIDGGGATNLTATFSDVSALTTHEYQLDYDAGSTSWSVINLTTGTSSSLVGGTAVGDSFTIDGMTITVAAVPTGDESFRIRPTRLGANLMSLAINDERDIAAAEPLLAAAAAGNGGTGSISAGNLTAVGTGASFPGTMALPVGIQYNSTGGGELQITGGDGVFVDADGNAITGNPAYSSGQTYYVRLNDAGTDFGTYSFTMTGTPNDADSFTIASNAGGVGDNRNARALADLQNANVMIGGTATFANTYGALVSDIGTRTQQAANNASIQENLLSQAESAKSEVSGVNLDEEAADLVRFQQAYQAAAQVINIANTLFDSLLGAVRR